MQKKWKSIELAVVSLGLALALILGSVVPAKAAGPERKVKIGLHAGFVGPVASTIAGMCQGQMDASEYLNKQGGINGIRVDVLWYETGRAPIPEAIIAHKRFKDAGVVCEIANFTMQGEALVPRLQRDEIPLFLEDPLIETLITKPQWIFGIDCTWDVELANAAKWFKENWTEARPPRLGLMLYDNSESRSFYMGRALPYTEEIGFEFVGYEVVPLLGTIDTSVEWLRLANKKPDLIFAMIYGSSQTTAIRDAARLGIQEKGIALCGSMAFVDVWSLRSAGAGALEGWYGTMPLAHELFPAVAGAKPIVEVAARKRGWMTPEEISIHYVGGWITVMLIHEGIRLALETVGLENLTGRAVRDGLTNIKDFDLRLGIAPVTMTDSRPYWNRGGYIEQVQQGKIVKLTGWRENVYNLEY